MSTSTRRLEDVLTEAGVSPESAPSVVAELQRFVDEAIAARAGVGPPDSEQGASVDSNEGRLIRLEQKLDHLRELMMVQFADVDRRFDEVDRRFGDVDRRFGDVDKRLERERLERLGFVTAAAGAITAALLRLFGAI